MLRCSRKSASLAKRTLARLFGRCWGRQFDVLDPERIKRLCDGDLGLGVKERVGELLALFK